MLKLMNGLYGVSLADNAVNTQEYLSKLISFLKYYTSDECRLVKLMDELAMIRLFGEMMTAGTGNSYNLSASFSDDESRHFYVPSKSILSLVIDLLLYQDHAAARKNITIGVRSEGHSFAISFTGSHFFDHIRIQQRAAEMKSAFETAYGPDISAELSDGTKDSPGIRLTVYMK